MADIVESVRQAIRDSGLSNYEIAKRSGVTAYNLGRLMGHGKSMTPENLQLVVRALGRDLIVTPSPPNGAAVRE